MYVLYIIVFIVKLYSWQWKCSW